MSAPMTWNEADRGVPTAYSLKDFWTAVLAPLASLKLTVILFALAIFIIFAGTLAQVDRDIWDVIRIYFRAPIAWIEPQIFFPPSFFGAWRPIFPEGFTFDLGGRVFHVKYLIPFPGGWMIGAVMALNLVAAHLVRFQVQARGARLGIGLVVIAVGLVLTWLVVQYGSNKAGLQSEPAISYAALWNLILASLMAGAGALAWGGIQANRAAKKSAWAWFAAAAVLGISVVWVWSQGDAARLNDSGMRILWQLSKGTFAGIVLLIGCVIVFGKRAGIVLLHGGVGLMMFGELLVGLVAVEGQMPIKEGQTTNFVHDIRTWELAIIEPKDDKEVQVIAIPKGAIQAALEKKQPIVDPRLPFKIEVLNVIPNAEPRRLKPDEKGIATKGLGTSMTVDELKQTSGTDSSGKIDQAAAYVKLTSNDGADLGTYLVGLTFSMLDFQDEVTVGDKSYQLALRFKRTYKPYSMTLKDVRKVDYVGTSTPRDYSSDVVLNDPTRNVQDRDVKIWMNNPLRFAGETFYQSNYFKDMRTGDETTTLAVVSNEGWMIPYVSCMIVALGMLAHFSITLSRFLQRSGREQTGGELASVMDNAVTDPRRRPAKSLAPVATTLASSQRLGLAGWLLPAAVVTLAAIGTSMQMRTPAPKSGQFDLYRFGQLPVVADGRAKPVDTLARHNLLAISSKQTFLDASEKRQPAVKWFLDLIATPRSGASYHVIRVENLEVQEFLGLERREGFRYSLAEIFKHYDKFMEEAKRASELPGDKRDIRQRKLLELKQKIDVFNKLFYSFVQPPLRGEGQELVQSVMFQVQQQERLKEEHPPLAIPPQKKDEEWTTYASAWLRNLILSQMAEEKASPFLEGWQRIFAAYEKGMTSDEGESSLDREKRKTSAAEEFNKEVASLHQLYREQTPAEVNLPRVEFEAYFNRVQPMTLAIGLYVTAFIIAALGWLCLAFNWRDGLRIAGRTAFALIAFTLIIHTLALVSRMYISGRPPVTNLYSSAVFIGWGCVVFGLMLEAIFRIGFGNVVAAVAGYATLLIAYNLESDGSDTFSVMQAVLDTQFWLATHVTCITLGYATTYLAGLFGLIYVLLSFTPWLTPQLGKDLTRMNYGTLCFSIFFSFVGTVLGGLWADDSWGRFWGWDPKENGALMIVLWNALALHARWGGLVKERGLALLAVAGNIVVSWSWFGVNALSIGLHAYGFDQRIFTTFITLTAVHLVIIVLALGHQFLTRRPAMR